MKKTVLLLSILLVLFFSACQNSAVEQPLYSKKAPADSLIMPNRVEPKEPYLDSSLGIDERVDDLLSKMTLEGKAGQMVQGEQSAVKESDIKKYGLGSVLSGGGSVPGNINTIENWQRTLDSYQANALERKPAIPILYGIDAVHGHNTLYGAVIFPQNIGLGAANDPVLVEQMGAAVAEEMKLSQTLWNFAPCVAVAQDPRWGRTYESYSSDPSIVVRLASAFAKGQLEHGVQPTAKHFLADGGTTYGTGEGAYLIDRGDAQMSEDDLRAIHLAPYAALVKSGVQIVMPSFSSFQGVKMHENKYLLTDVLKTELGFKGFVISDWEAVNGLSGGSFDKNVVLAVNAGVDMLMQPYNYAKTIEVIVKAAKDGSIRMERIDEAVRRILTVKMTMGLFEDPFLKKSSNEVKTLGSEPYRHLAKQLVEKSLVLLKNDNNTLPLNKGQTILLTGPAMDDIGVQCGGWTLSWQGHCDANGKEITPGSTITESLEAYCKTYGINIVTDPKRANEADVVLLAVGEIPYAEYEGDTADLSLTGFKGLEGNLEAIRFAKSLHKPIIALIVAGRNVLIDEYIKGWDSVVMCYLPGTEGDGIASVLVGESPFSGKLPMPYYRSVDDIGKTDAKLLYDLGYGLTY